MYLSSVNRAATLKQWWMRREIGSLSQEEKNYVSKMKAKDIQVESHAQGLIVGAKHHPALC